jgi:hypothetical protein
MLDGIHTAQSGLSDGEATGGPGNARVAVDAELAVAQARQVGHGGDDGGDVVY